MEKLIEYSIVVWNRDCDVAPNLEDLLVVVRDDSGDTVNTFVATAWRAEYGEMWVCNNEPLCGDVIAWSKMPEPKRIATISQDF